MPNAFATMNWIAVTHFFATMTTIPTRLLKLLHKSIRVPSMFNQKGFSANPYLPPTTDTDQSIDTWTETEEKQSMERWNAKETPEISYKMTSIFL